MEGDTVVVKLVQIKNWGLMKGVQVEESAAPGIDNDKAVETRVVDD